MELVRAERIERDIHTRFAPLTSHREHAAAVPGHVLEAVPWAVIVLTTDGAVLEANGPARALGRPTDAGVGQPVWDWPAFAAPAGLRERLQDLVERAVRGEACQAQVGLHTANAAAPVILRAAPVRGEAGVVTHVVLAQTEASAALGDAASPRADDRAQRIIESIADGLITVDEDWCILFVNSSAERMLAASAAAAGGSLVGRNLWEAFPRAIGTVFEETYRRVLAEQRPARFEAHYPELGWFYVRAFPRRDGGLAIYFLDVTDLKEAEAEISRTQALIEGITRGTRDGIAAQDAEFRFVYFNDAYAQLFRDVWGRELELGADMRELLAPWPEQEQRAREIWARAHAGETFRVQGAFGPSPAEERVFELQFSPIVEGERGQVAACQIVREVSEQIRLQRSLSDSEADLRAMFEVASVGIVQTDPRTGRLLRFNERFCEITGYGADELSQLMVLELSHPEDRAADAQNFRAAAASGAGDYHVEKRYVRKDGAVVWVRVSAAFIRDAAGQAVRAVAVVDDISDRKAQEAKLAASEQRFRRLAELLPQLVWTARADGTPDYYNSQASRYGGLERRPDGTFTWEPLVHPEDQARTVRAWTESVATGRPYECEHRIQMAGGGFRWHLSRAQRFADQGQLRWFGSAIDLHDQKLAEQSLRRSHEELERRVAQRTRELQRRADQLSRLTSELTLTEHRERRRFATLLHDHLQQLLVAAKFALHAADRQPGPDEPRARRAGKLIDEALEASRTLTLELSPPVLHEGGLAAGLDWLARRMLLQHGLRVELDGPSDFDVPREDVRLLVFEAVRELLFNVVKHAGVDAARVSFAPAGQDQFVVLVADEGRGLETDAGLNDGLYPEESGGFGLFSIRERFALLGGSLSIDSRPGAGARFRLTAPLGAPAAAPAPPAPPAKRAEPGARRIRLLLADDHRVIRQGLAALVAAEPDMQVVGQAADGAEAIELAREHRPDIILMDYGMPGMPVLEAVRTISATLPRVRIIGLSMYEEPDRAAAMLDAGAQSYLTKSGDTATLLERIRSVAAG